MFVLGTAGHIDHGKSALVKALTGMDPDRLREEKERGMTIDLGFAWFTLPGGREVAVVDVPGHERFIKNMLAGVGSIDLAMLVVAANESVMPQTREHLAILDLLGISKGVVAITKKDMVDNEWMDLVRMEVDEILRTTCLAGAPIVAVSAVTGEGIKELALVIDHLLDEATPRQDTGNPRLPVDRIFTISGSGTVVTGTLIDGSLSVGQEVEIVPSGLTSRIRGLQMHRSRVEKATPGNRVAVNLVGVATTDLVRGYVLTRPGWLRASRMMGVQLKLLPYLARPLPHGAEVSFHTSAAETMARVRLLEKDKLGPGETTWAQLELAEPVAVVRGDHFIIRSPVETLGGGKIIDLSAKRFRRFRESVIESLRIKEAGKAEEIILGRVEAKQPVELAELQAKCEVSSDEVEPAVEALLREGRLVQAGEGEHALIFSTAGWKRLAEQATSILQDYHRRFSLRAGMSKVELASRLKLGKNTADIWARLAAEGIVAEDGLTVRLPSHRPGLAPAQKAQVDAFMRALEKEPYSPAIEVMPDAEVLNYLAEQHRIVKVSDTVVFSTGAYNEMVEKLIAYLREKNKVTLAEVRDLFHTSRKYAQALLEQLDEKKVTRRVGDERVLYQKS